MTSMNTPKAAIPPISFSISFFGTCPMNIIIITTKNSSAAVDRFSSAMGPMRNMQISIIYLNAFLSAPFGVCIALRICATANITVPLAISEGWNCMPRNDSHLLAPLVDCPATSTQSSVTKDRKIRIGVASLKYLHCTFSTQSMANVPKASMVTW